MNGTFVKDVSASFQGEARLYRLEDDRFVVISSNNSDTYFPVNETMVFLADQSGEVLSWADLAVVYPAGEWERALEAIPAETVPEAAVRISVADYAAGFDDGVTETLSSIIVMLEAGLPVDADTLRLSLAEYTVAVSN